MASKSIIESGKRKTAVARASVKQGKGKVSINNTDINLITPITARMRMMEPIIIAGDAASKMDISIKVNGGGISSQADAVRLAIAKAIVTFTKNNTLKKDFMTYDRQLLVADVRRKEPSKPNRHSQARAKRQKSYR